MKVIEGIKEMSAAAKSAVREGKAIALVPTMGFLHNGHASLIRQGRKRGDLLVVSIFVNPTQFGEGEDLDRYPRDIKRDMDILETEGVDILFLPSAQDMYREGFQTYVEVERLSRGLCGASRPGHFRGVATIVAKLFNIVGPDVAIFGEKDYQQLAVIKKMADDLNFDMEILGMPIVREDDGLAMSSRNSYLSPDERVRALSLGKALRRGEELFIKGERQSKRILDAAAVELAEGVGTDYLGVYDPETLEPLEKILDNALLAVAARIGNTRLIDNMILKEEMP